MKCIIVDDNEIARATIRKLAAKVPDLNVVAECEDAIAAHYFLSRNTVDLVFLDVEMPGMTGIDLVKNLGRQKPLIIFITAKKEYALDAYDLNVADYLLKPIQTARFVRAVEKVREILDSNKDVVEVVRDQFIFIRDSNVVKRLGFDDIIYAEAMGDYVKLHTPQRFYAIHNSLKNVQKRLPPDRFQRVHRSYIVAVGRIDTIREGDLVIGDHHVPVADAYRAALNRRLNIL